MKIASLIKPDLSFVLQDIGSRNELLGQLADHIASKVQNIDAAALEAALTQREEQGPTSTPEGVAFPHAMYDGVGETLVAVARIKGGVDFGRKGQPPSDIVFALVGPPDSAWQHVSVLARLARICHRPGALDNLRRADDAQSLFDRLIEEDGLHG
jgi:mannitol/fructose-specific phosphotransferase system IIA component (Ntr-type)